RPFFSEVELAILKDIGHDINLKDFFGKSYYQNGDSTIAENNTGFNSAATQGIGLHIVSNYHNLVQNANLTASGFAGTGIRIEGTNNKITNDAVIEANGEEGVGILVINGGTPLPLINRGTIEATGQHGRGVWFSSNGLGGFASSLDNTGTINANDAIYIDKNAYVAQINLMKGSIVKGNIISNNEGQLVAGGITKNVSPILLTFGKLANDNGEAIASGDTSSFAISITGNIGGTGSFDLETWGGLTILSAATLNFNTGTIGADPNNIASSLDLAGTVSFKTLNLGSADNTSSDIYGNSYGRVFVSDNNVENYITVEKLAHFQVLKDLTNTATGQFIDNTEYYIGGKLTNAGTIDGSTFVDVWGGDVDNAGLIQNVTKLKVETADLNNAATGQLIDNTTIEVTGQLDNKGTIDGGLLVDIKGGDIDNSGLVQNVAKIQTTADLNNAATGQFIDNTTIEVTGQLDNKGTIDGGLLVDVTGDIDNSNVIQNVATVQTDANLKNTATGQLVSNTNIKVGEKLTNAGLVDTANLVKVTGDIDNTGLVQNVATVQTDTNLSNNITGKLLNNTTIKVGEKLKNAGLIDTANLIDVTGDIDNVNPDFANNKVGLIQNVVTLQTAANLNNTGSGAQIVDNKTINAGVNLTNDGLIDRFTTVNVGQDVINNSSGYINVANDSAVNIGRNGSNSGHVKVNGNVNVENQFINNAAVGSYVTGAGTVTTKNGFINRGNIAPGNSIDTLTIVGPFVNDTTGTLHIELDPSHYPSKPFAGLHNDLIDVHAGTVHAGTATINGGNVVVTSPTNDKTKTATPARYVGNTHYIFLDTDNNGNMIVNNVLTAHDPADILLFDFLADHDTKSYWLDVQREYYYGKFGDTFNQVAVGDYIDEIGLDPDPTGDFFNVLVTLDRLNGGIAHRAGISKAAKFSLDQMSGAIYGTIANAGIQNTTIVNNTLADVLRRDAFGKQNDCNPCETICATKSLSRWNTWGLGYGTGGETQFDDNAYGYNQSFAGTLVGVDRSYKRNIRIGAFASYGEGKISSDLLEHSKSKEFLAGLYFRKGMRIGYILASGGLGNNRYDTERTISFVNRKTENKHDAIVGTVYLERGLEFKNRYGFLQPFFGIQYVGSQQNGFAEHGAQSLNLVANSTDGHSLRSLLGSRFSTNSRTVNKGKLSLYGNAIWMHEFLRSYTNFTAEFSNPGLTNFSAATNFTVRGNDAKRDWAIIGVGLNYDKNRVRLFGGYDAYANGQQVLHTGNAGIVYGW
ncbi:MAG: autotransporter domain-containing protein, partial [Planctomycetaceae bacterium]|nr:autotransporter domain-containing protein [Planctomycetaceae bacterium]